MKKSTLILILCILVAGVLLKTPVAAMNNETMVKTVFIFNLTKHIKWPEKGDEFIIGTVSADNKMITALKAMADKKSTPNRRIVIKELTSASASDCHMIFIPNEETNKLPAVINSHKDKKVLIVTDKPGLGKKGSAINFVQHKGKLTFELNENEIEKRGLKVSGQLKSVAILIK